MDEATKIFRDWIFSRLSRTGDKTQTGLADALSIAHPQVSMLKQGKRDLKVREVPIISKFLEAPPPPWPGTAKASTDAEIIALLKQIDGLPEGSLVLACGMIRSIIANSGEQSPQSQSRGQSEPTNHHHESEPSR